MKTMDIIDDYKSKVDLAIKFAKQIDSISLALDEIKQFLRDTGAKLIGIDEKSIKFSGKNGTIMVTYPEKKKVKFNSGITIESLPPKLKDMFFKQVTKFEPVSNFEELSYSNKDILKYVSLVNDTPRVIISK